MGRTGGAGADVSPLPRLFRAAHDPGDGGDSGRLAALAAPFAVTVYALWQARDLLDAWRDAPYERGGWVVLLLWLAPLARRRAPAATDWLGGGLALLVAGALTALHALDHLGLAAVLTAWRDLPARYRWVYVAAALAWLPTSGWFLAKLGLAPLPALGVRIGLAAAGALAGGRR